MSAVRCLMSVGGALTRVVVSLPVVLVVALIAADWYSFTVDYAILHRADHPYPALTAVATAVFNVCLCLTLWSYHRTITTSSSVRENPPPADYYAKYRIHHPEQPIRVCARCQGQPKPLRAHRQRQTHRGLHLQQQRRHCYPISASSHLALVLSRSFRLHGTLSRADCSICGECILKMGQTPVQQLNPSPTLPAIPPHISLTSLSSSALLYLLQIITG